MAAENVCELAERWDKGGRCEAEGCNDLSKKDPC